MDFLVFRRVVLSSSLTVALVEKLVFFLFVENVLSVTFLQSSPFFPPIHSIESDMMVSYTVYTRFSSQSSGALSDTRVFGMPFLENMTLRICFTVEVFLSGARITSGLPEKESTSINRSPTPVMYAWSICTRLHGSTFWAMNVKKSV